MGARWLLGRGGGARRVFFESIRETVGKVDIQGQKQVALT